jgi:predicted nucleic acid-binding protein
MQLVCCVVDRFHLYSAIDTCAIWHLISSMTLNRAATQQSCNFIVSRYVEYECFDKPRKHPTKEHDQLVQRLKKDRASGCFQTIEMSIDDLQEIARLEERRKLGKGELSSIALAKKIGIGLTTDDRKAFRFAKSELSNPEIVQTIPQLLGWLYFKGNLTDHDVRQICAEHLSVGGSHQEHFEGIYFEACRCKLMSTYPCSE